MRLPAGEPLWPIRDDQRPEVAHTAEEFLEAMLLQPQLDRVVVLPGGIDLLRQQNALPEALRDAVARSSNMRDMMNIMPEEARASFKARLWHYGNVGSEKEIREGGRTRTLSQVRKVLYQRQDEGAVPHGAPLYISELRWLTKVEHPVVKGERVKTALNCDVYDFTPLSRNMPFWERSEGGIFVGERGTGSGFHVDQCLWSNVGRNWCGFKLFAIWPYDTERHAILDEAGKGTVLHLPLSPEHREYLRRAKTVALVGPGDVWCFSGGQPHTALVVGDGLNVSAYESFVPAHPDAVSLLVRSNTKAAHWRKCWMDDEDLDELYEDVVDAIQRSLADAQLPTFLRPRLLGCVQAMRRDGDAYCRELWKQEDDGQRRRRREEESDSDAGAAPGSGCDQGCQAAAGQAETSTMAKAHGNAAPANGTENGDDGSGAELDAAPSKKVRLSAFRAPNFAW